MLPQDLVGQPFVLFETGSITRRAVDEFFMTARIEPQIVMETENVEIIKAMVRNGLGISIIPWQAVARDVRSRQLFCSRIEGRSLVRETGWLYPKMSRTPRAVQEVIQRLRARAAEARSWRRRSERCDRCDIAWLKSDHSIFEFGVSRSLGSWSRIMSEATMETHPRARHLDQS